MSTEGLVLGSMVRRRFLAESLRRGARVQSQVERNEPKGSLDGFLARLHRFPRNKGKPT